jgi:hypothetical protein
MEVFMDIKNEEVDELQDLTPQDVDWRVNFTIDGQKYDEIFTFRKFSLADEAWLKKRWPGKKLKEVFDNLDMGAICEIAFRVLTMSSKKKLFDIEFEDMDENGNVFEIATTGSEKLQMIVTGLKSQTQLIDHLLKTRGLSLAKVEKLAGALDEAEKKKATKKA